MSDLKLCPFCGGNAELTTWTPTATSISCIMCGAHFNTYTEAEAIEAWNTRSDAALNKAAGNWAHADKLLRGLLEECERCPDTGCTLYIEKVVKPNMRTSEQAVSATLGRGECEMLEESEYVECKVQTFTCSACGWHGAIDDLFASDTRPNYCPNCGAKVVS